MIPIVALVGRPNVGKSTLFNRLVGKQLAIVANEAGVTRDRQYADALLRDRAVTLVDTGGFDPADEDPMRQGIARGVYAAIAEADVVVCVLDALHPPTEADRQAVQLLRKSDAQVVYLANRADNEKLGLVANDLYQLGIEPLIAGSALHGRRIAELQDAIIERLPPPAEAEQKLFFEDSAADAAEEGAEEGDASETHDDVPAGPIRMALLGRPNAGKSSLLNYLSKTERSLVDERPGTTRDPIDAVVDYGGKRYRVVDTAGVRRKARVSEGIEAASVMRSLRMMSEAEIVVLLCDASDGLAEQDAKLLSLTTDRGKPVVVAMNKIDLLSKKQQKDAIEAAKTTLHFAPWVPVMPLSVKTGKGTPALMRWVERAHAEFTRRIPTSQLNRFVAEVIDRTPPPSKQGRVAKIYYMTQVQTAPPLFVAMCSSPQALSASYRRFVQNQLRSAFGFESIPMRIRFRARRRRDAPE